VAHGLVFAGIGLNLGVIQRHMAQAHHVGLLTQPQDLNKKVAQRVEVAASEFAVAIGFLRISCGFGRAAVFWSAHEKPGSHSKPARSGASGTLACGQVGGRRRCPRSTR
jgi:hypothetical protein